MLKSLLLSFSLLFSLSVLAQTQPEDQAQLEALIQNSFDAIFSEFDEGKLTSFYTEDFLLLEQGEVWDMDMVRSYLSRAKSNPNPSVRTNRFDYIKTVIEGDRAWIAYHNYATISRDGEVIRELYWLESATAVRTPEGWRLDMLHSTRVEI
ncbi:DUF4440 domain-containing protein [Algoriphagus confluentis]|uniref:Nuclear transport factor 2 family protein n=1 Tax=Algoriphagus confluentis TaxID=1697556 RepID=A0ABQ6PKD2_9BACT|nr:hypothetical protein Aconfl_10700 [Algoriphagus confluentis]